MKKKLLLLLAACICLSIFNISAPNVKAAGLSLAQLQTKFPHGSFWNSGNPDTVTYKACTHHSPACDYYGNCGCNSFHGAIQCNGFANKLTYDYYGSTFVDCWSRTTDTSVIKAGDVICYVAGYSDGIPYNHYIWVTARSGDTITIADCNINKNCGIRWGKNLSISGLSVKPIKYIAQAPYALTESPSSGTTNTHSYVRDVEALHPHREYMMCSSCSENYYTGNNGYSTVYETAHPHKGYYACSVANCSYNGTYTGDIGSTTQYESTHPYREYISCVVESCAYHNTYTGNTLLPVAPTNVQASVSGSNVTVSWTASTNATHYDVYLLQEPCRWEDIKYSQTAYSTYAVFNDVAAGDYYAFVIARPNENTVQSYWYPFKVYSSAPYPPNIMVNAEYEKVNRTIIVSWNPVENAEKYVYYLTEYPEGYAYTTNKLSGETTNTSVSFTNLGAGRYTIFVHSLNSFGRSEQSNWISFDVYDDDYVPVVAESFNGHIYALYDYELSWSFARDLCQNMGGHLVTITSPEENEFVASMINKGSKEAYWLGALDYVNYPTENGEYRWVTDEPFEYTNWYTGEPSRSGYDGEKEHFVEIRKAYSNKWNDVNNINKSNKGFIIEIEPDNSYISKEDTFNSNRYLLIDKKTTWTEAKLYCEMLGGHLVVINDEAEETFINRFIENGTHAWYYMGAEKRNGEWQWLDEQPVGDIKWIADVSYITNTYMMKYKEEKVYNAINNTYYPAHHINNIGFICEIGQATIEAIVTKTNSSYKVETALQGIATGTKIIVIGYKNGAVVDIKSRDYTQKNETFVLEGDIDEIKVMVWDSLSGLMPICEAEIIPKSEWLIE